MPYADPEKRRAKDRSYQAAKKAAEKAGLPRPHGSRVEVDNRKRLKPDDRIVLAYLAHMALWSDAALGREFDCSRKAVYKARNDFTRTR